MIWAETEIVFPKGQENLPPLREIFWLAKSPDEPFSQESVAYAVLRPDAPPVFILACAAHRWWRRVWLPGGLIQASDIMAGSVTVKREQTLSQVTLESVSQSPTSSTRRSRGNASLKKAAQASFSI